MWLLGRPAYLREMDQLPFYSLAPQHDLIRSDLDNCFRKLLERGNFILGDEVSAFEKEWAAFTGVRHCVAVANGSDAITLSLRALGIGPGDEVIVPAFTCAPTWMAVLATRARVVPVDVDRVSASIRADQVESVVSPKLRAIIPVHLYGQSADMKALMALSDRLSIPLIEDNAQGHGARCGDQMTGSMGLLSATSFYPTKNLGALGDGGAITTDNDSLAATLRSMRNYGSSARFHHALVGVNSRLDEVHAAVLRIKLRHLENWNNQRQVLARQYRHELSGVGDIQWQEGLHVEGANHHLVVMRTLHRDNLVTWLRQRGIGVDVHYPLSPHQQPAFRELGFRQEQFPMASLWARTVLSLPAWPGMTAQQLSLVCDAIRSFYANGVSKQ